MFNHTPQEFVELRAAIHARQLERLRTERHHRRIELFYGDLKAELEAKFAEAQEWLKAGRDVSHIRLGCYVHECDADEENLIAHRLLNELREAGFKADIHYKDEGEESLDFMRTRTLVVALSGV